MSSESSNAETIFGQAIAISDEGDRGAYLNRACADDPALRRAVDELVASYFQAGSFLEQPAVSPGMTFDQPASSLLGTRVGPYKLLQEIGEGGMGVVYMAEQAEPVQRWVALKIIKPGMDSRKAIARFEAERQALALMDHPNIAKVLDAGTTDSGRLYFVMELVKGMPITTYCDENHLTPAERLGLFLSVCQAVQHAHQKGIIHRDLKPTNVLVAMYDRDPVPKVIDFGIAKATAAKLTEKTLFTELGQVVGTLEYMSPEQAQLNQLDIDTRSDIYSLGVLLYELLTGTTPLERKRLNSAAFDEMLRIIREEDPPKPSTRLSTTDELPSIAANRGLEPRKLSGLMRGDLDWIVMKALDKDRSRRYETANSLAMDIQRYLADEPVLACPPSAHYRFSKFARRHRTALLTIGVVALALIAGTVASALQAIRATQAEHIAQVERERADVKASEAEKNARTAINEKHRADGKAAEAEANAEQARQEQEAARRLLYSTDMNLAQRAWADGSVGQVLHLLGRHDPAKGQQDLRDWEWHYLSRLCHDDLRTLKGHTNYVRCVAFSPDGKRIASGGDDTTVKLWDTERGAELATLKGHTGSVKTVAFSPCGKHLASGGGDKIKLWDVESYADLRTFKGHTDVVTGVAFSPDGRRIASCSHDSTLKLWDTERGGELATLKGHATWVDCVAFSPDGTRIVSGSWDGVTKLWDAEAGGELATLKTGTRPVRRVSFSPDGKRIASGNDDKTIDLWDAASNTGLRTLRVGAGLTNSVTMAFSPDGKRIASGDDDQMIKLWDVETGTELATLKGHTGAVMSVAFHPDGKSIASCSDDKTIKLWDKESGSDLTILKAHTGGVLSVAFSSDQKRIASGGWDNTIKTWDAETGAELRTLKGHTNNVRTVAFSPDCNRIVSGSDDMTIKLWDAQSGTELATLKGHTGHVLSVAFSPDGKRIASGSEDNTIKLWEAETGTELATLKGHTRVVHSVAFSPDGKRIASGSEDTTIKLWDAEGGVELRTFKGHAYGVNSVSFSSDGRRLASAGADPGDAVITIKLWDAVTGAEGATLTGHTKHVPTVAFSPNGSRIVSGSWDNTIKLWDAESGAELATLAPHIGPVFGVAFSPDGNRIVSGSYAIALYDATMRSPDEKMARFLAKQIIERHPMLNEALADLDKQTHWNDAMREAARKYVLGTFGR